ncbi:hypothetical protein YC2023_031327 [Brassica napus]
MHLPALSVGDSPCIKRLVFIPLTSSFHPIQLRQLSFRRMSNSSVFLADLKAVNVAPPPKSSASSYS